MRNSGGCLTGLVAFFSRLILLSFWLSRPVAFNAAFGGGFILPCLGFLILPFTTMVYVWLQTGQPGPLQAIDWLWLALAAIVDIASTAGAGVANRDRIPAGYPGAIQS